MNLHILSELGTMTLVAWCCFQMIGLWVFICHFTYKHSHRMGERLLIKPEHAGTNRPAGGDQSTVD